jgi:hypothetical protein
MRMLIGTLSLVVVVAVAASSAAAKGGTRVTSSGTCSAAAAWKLSAQADDGRIETEFEVDANRVGKRWRVTLIRNGSIVFSGIRTTVAPSGSFTVRRLLAAPASGRIVVSAIALDGGQRCRGQLSL